MSDKYINLSFVEAVKQFGSQIKAARALNIPASTFSVRLSAEKSKIVEPDPAPTTAEKPRVRVQAGSSRTADLKPEQPTGTFGPIVRPMFGTRNTRGPQVILPVSERFVPMCFLGDLHCHPSIEDECERVLRLAGEHILRTKPEVVVIGGDWSDWASCCHHEKNYTWKGKFKPTVREDVECAKRLLNVLNEYLDDVQHKVFLWGNHEDWVNQYENEHPEVHGEYTSEIVEMFELCGFQQYRYGEYAFIGGIGFTHVPKNKMDRPVGGQTGENTVAMQSTHDVVYCHTHVNLMGRRTKFGYRNAVTVWNGGCIMPVGYVGEYAQRTTGSFVTSGVLDLDCADGRIAGHAWTDMAKLEFIHGDAVDIAMHGGLS